VTVDADDERGKIQLGEQTICALAQSWVYLRASPPSHGYRAMRG
jgi:hypothetical protein